ncbi:hypothetical protein PLUTE_a1843 [Pseudoalteromonas luteoviolacea DSM 6061]|nr:hypothetical protein [Pseudoalteromonas luteoviolacea DSM 6061]
MEFGSSHAIGIFQSQPTGPLLKDSQARLSSKIILSQYHFK